MSHRPHPANVAGDFYVEDGCCTMCEVPFAEAPTLFGACQDPQGYPHCYVKRQPDTAGELDQMVLAIRHAEFPCIRYRGTDKVILDRNGTLESLMLPRQSGPPLGMTAQAPPPLPTADNPIVDRMRQLIANEPNAISEIIRPQPVFAQGKQRGFRVYPGRNRQAFTRIGLRPGDG